MMTINICTSLRAVRRRILRCPICQRRTRFIEEFHGWYDTQFTCVACGDSWAAGERAPRPFARGWRAEAIASARREWDEADSPAAFRAAVEAFVRELVA